MHSHIIFIHLIALQPPENDDQLLHTLWVSHTKRKEKTAGKQADDQLAFCYLLSLMRPPNWDVREARILVRAGCMWLAVAIPVKHK